MHMTRRNLLKFSAPCAGAMILGSQFGSPGALGDLIRPGPSHTQGALPKLPIGMNLTGIADWEPGFPFRNLMWGARAWSTRNASGHGPWDTKQAEAFKFDGNGYPTEAPIRVADLKEPQVPFTLLPNVRKPGQYVLLYDGEGEFQGVMGVKILSVQPGRILLEMAHKRGLVGGLAIVRSRLDNHVRNMRVLPLEDEKADLGHNPFLTEFLDFCRPFHSLRFMDWAATNGSLEEVWADRKMPTFYTMVGESGDAEGLWGPKPAGFIRRLSGGVSIEVMLHLANLLQIDPWLCVPHRASDEYIDEYAKLVKERLDPRLKVYVECSNEMWNWGFQQAQWMIRSRLAGELIERKGVRAWESPSAATGTNHPERIGALFRRTFEHWEKHWTGRDRQRLIRVCAVQAAWTEAAERTARWCYENGGADVISPAGYVGPSDREYKKWSQRGEALTVDELFTDMKAILERESALLRAQAALARKYGMGYVTYEGGQHLQPESQSDQPYSRVLHAAQSHPGMYDIYIDNLRLHSELGCDLFCAFASISEQGTRWGSWGAKASYDQPLSEAPKMRALLDCNMPR